MLSSVCVCVCVCVWKRRESVKNESGVSGLLVAFACHALCVIHSFSFQLSILGNWIVKFKIDTIYSSRLIHYGKGSGVHATTWLQSLDQFAMQCYCCSR